MGRREALHASHEGEENRKSVHGVVTQITVGMNAGGYVDDEHVASHKWSTKDSNLEG
jgi:hypothetical protein